MSPILRNSLLAFAVAVLLGAALGVLAGPAWGWAAAAGVFAGGFLHHARHLAKLRRWVLRPQPGKVPEGSASWDEVLTALHRYERSATSRADELADALVRFRRAAQAMPDAVVLLDARHCIEWCNDNAAAMLGLDARKDVGRPISNLVRDPGFVEALAAAAIDDGVSVRVALDARVLSIRMIPYGESETLVLARDVTQAERVETMRRDFVANVSHELRTPLTVLSGFLETVRELKLDPRRVLDYLGMMAEQASRMQRIIDDLLVLSVLEAAPPPSPERVRVAPLLERLRSDAVALSGGRHAITLEGHPGADLLGSANELASAFGNLVSNAVRYTPAGGSVKLEWRDGAEGASFSVADSGPGIAAEHIPRLTERFYRIDRSRSRETGGTGLGLAIVKHALARHQGSLEIESELGKGSRFTARFPPQRMAAVPAQSTRR